MTLKTSSSAIGCTDKFHSVRGHPADYNKLNLRIVDTVGLGESSEGTIPNEEAITMIEDKLDSLYNHEGINLILFCIRKGRQTEDATQNYRGIVHELCENQVPCVLVITCCEDDEPLGEWWENNKTILNERLKLDPRDAVSVTTINNEETKADYEESRRRLIDAILKNSLEKPWKTHGIGKKLRNFFAKTPNRSTILRPQKNDLQQYLQRPMDERKPSRSIFSRFWN